MPDLRHLHSTHYHSNNNENNLYDTPDISHVSDQSDTRDVSPSASKRYKSAHQRRDMAADDLKRAARQSRKERQTSREPPSNTNSWLNSFSKLFGIAVNDQNADNDTAAHYITAHETNIQQQQHATQRVSSKQRFDLDPHHPADYGSDEEIHTSLLAEPDAPPEPESNAAPLDDDDLISRTDLQDLVRLFRRMFTTLEAELNQTKARAQSPPPSSAGHDLSSALAQAHELNRRKELERKRVLAISGGGGDDEPEAEEDNADREQTPEFPVGSPAYESRKRIMRGLSGVAENERGAERPASRRVTARYRRVRGDDRGRWSQAMGAGLLPYL
ncbi:hypothetical protein FGB62_23g230 [Gracilaria domingensis]|nr:hypothetical protein FGB62_23g230 [Gracilaria domingensis]